VSLKQDGAKIAGEKGGLLKREEEAEAAILIHHCPFLRLGFLPDAALRVLPIFYLALFGYLSIQ